MNEIIKFVDSLMEKSTPDTPAWNIEHVLEGKETKWNYIDGCMIKAILDLHYATGDKKYYDFAKGYIDFFLSETGDKILGYSVEEYNCDNINMGKVLFDFRNRESDDKKYKNAIALLGRQLQTQPRINAGNFWHKNIYPNQVWLDGLYMVQPFYVSADTYQDVFKQFKNVYEIMRCKKTGLYFHGYDESREMFWADKDTGLSRNFWTRSIGWFTMALVDTAERLNKQFLYEYETLQKYLKEVLDALLKVADPETKMFYQVTNEAGRVGNYLETSGSCAIAYSFMKGARLGFLPSYYFDYGKEIFDSVAAHKLVLGTDGIFTLKDICLVAGLGGMPGKGDYQPRDGTFEYYISEPRVDNDAKGVAPFLFAYAEILRKGKK
ncbi:MAG: glycoside hydrolase family 88 protein [Defluviitaleaceae bacterium]|nr:glycoside hydrolase family 88 protein [Defluviitaleaceae bacterium]